MTYLTVHTKSLSHCPQCDMTVKTAIREGLAIDVKPGIDTPERADELKVFKEEYGLAAAPIVEARSNDGRVIERWAGFIPAKIKQYAEAAVA